MAVNPNPSRITDASWWFMEQLLLLQPGSRNGGIFANKCVMTENSVCSVTVSAWNPSEPAQSAKSPSRSMSFIPARAGIKTVYIPGASRAHGHTTGPISKETLKPIVPVLKSHAYALGTASPGKIATPRSQLKMGAAQFAAIRLKRPRTPRSTIVMQQIRFETSCAIAAIAAWEASAIAPSFYEKRRVTSSAIERRSSSVC